MSTVQQIINRSLRLVGSLAAGESATAGEQSDALLSLNAMIGAWSAARLNIFALTETAFNMTSGTASYTIGSGGAISAARPIRIEQARLRITNIDYPLDILTQEEYEGITDKASLTAQPTSLFYKSSYPLGVIYPYPVANQTYAATIFTWAPLTSFAAVSTSVSLPDGYEEAITYNLAIRLAPEYGKSASGEVIAIARDTLSVIKRNNLTPIIATLDVNSMGNKEGGWDIWSDQ